MAFPEDRLSTTVEEATYLDPDGAIRGFHEDYDRGPIAIGDMSQGGTYQEWHGSYDWGTEWIVLTPDTTGSPQSVLNIPNLSELSFCFDQNGNITVVYVQAGVLKLYYYDTLAQDFATLIIPGGLSGMVTLDDKRARQSALHDIMLIYTKDDGIGGYELHSRRQRDRFDPEIPLNEACYRYMLNLGMHEGLRVQITTTNLGSN